MSEDKGEAIGPIEPGGWNAEIYREANSYGRSIYEQFYKHAGISFGLNAILLTAISVIFGKDGMFQTHFDLATASVVFVVALGVVFNLGALTAYSSSAFVLRRLLEYAQEVEPRLQGGGLELAHKLNGVPQDGFWAAFAKTFDVVWLTKLFYSIFICGWVWIGVECGKIFGYW